MVLRSGHDQVAIDSFRSPGFPFDIVSIPPYHYYLFMLVRLLLSPLSPCPAFAIFAIYIFVAVVLDVTTSCVNLVYTYDHGSLDGLLKVPCRLVLAC